MDTHIPSIPIVPHLSMIPGPFKSPKKYILWHFLAAARMVIPCYCKTTPILPLLKWAIELDSIRRLEHMLSQENDREKQFSKTWTSWSMFRYLAVSGMGEGRYFFIST